MSVTDKLFCALAVAILVSACSTTPGSTPRDTFEGFNRTAFAFNQKVALGSGKKHGMHHPTTLATNIFDNVSEVPDTLNHMLQGKPHDALDDILRLAFNSTLGLAGVFDVASEMGIPKKSGDFGETLGKWGVRSGPYVVLPFLGPSTLRDVAALPVDTTLDPLTYVKPSRDANALVLVRILAEPDKANIAEENYPSGATDPYVRQRDAWMKARAREIHD